MRITIYSVSRKPILRKKLAYVAALVSDYLADPVNPHDITQGVILRGINGLRADDSYLHRAAGSGFDTAWHIRQSGFAGPLTWQLKTQRSTA